MPNPAGPAVFVAYRRSDSEEKVDFIVSSLRQRFGREAIFRDHDSIPLGVQFPDHIRSVLRSAKVCLVIIGPDWVLEMRKRKDDPNDYHRLEIEIALERPDIKLVPLLVQGAKHPNHADLLPSLQALATLNSQEIRKARDYEVDIERLSDHLSNWIPRVDQASPPPAKPSVPPWAYATLAVVLAGGSYVAWNGSGTKVESPDSTQKASKTDAPVTTPNPGPGGDKPSSASSAVQKRTASVINPPLGGGAPSTPAVKPPAAESGPKVDPRQKAMTAAEAGQCAELDSFLNSDPNDGSAFFLLGQCHSKAGQVAAARQAFGKAITLGFSLPRTHTELARLALTAGDTAEAVRQADSALRAERGFTPAMLLKADVLMKQRKYTDAVKAYEAIYQKTGSADSCRKLAEAYEANGAESLAESQRSACAAK